MNVPIASISQARQLAPAEVVPTEERFRIDRLIRDNPVAVEQRRQRSTMKISWNRRLREVQDRRDKIHVLNGNLHSPASSFASRRLDDEWHTQRVVVDQQTMCIFAMISQALTM